MAEAMQIWRRQDGAELLTSTDRTGTIAVYTPDNHYIGVMSERELMELGYALVPPTSGGERGGRDG